MRQEMLRVESSRGRRGKREIKRILEVSTSVSDLGGEVASGPFAETWNIVRGWVRMGSV